MKLGKPYIVNLKEFAHRVDKSPNFLAETRFRADSIRRSLLDPDLLGLLDLSFLFLAFLGLLDVVSSGGLFLRLGLGVRFPWDILPFRSSDWGLW